MKIEAAEIQDWLRRFKWSLTVIPSPERDDIVQEVTGHILESVNEGATVANVLDQFGSPEEYARCFVDQMKLSRALSSQTGGAQLEVVVSHADRSMIAAGSAIALLLLGGVFLICVVLTVLKVCDPAHVGLWRNAKVFFIGKIDEPASATDILGNWFYPSIFSIAAVSWWVSRFLLSHVVKAISRNQPRSPERHV